MIATGSGSAPFQAKAIPARHKGHCPNPSSYSACRFQAGTASRRHTAAAPALLHPHKGSSKVLREASRLTRRRPCGSGGRHQRGQQGLPHAVRGQDGWPEMQADGGGGAVLAGGMGAGRMSRLDRLLYRVTEAVPAVGSPEVLRRAAVTMGVMAFFRLGKRIPLHGLDYARLAANMGPAASVESAYILMLGIAPMASGSLFVMLLNAFPQVSPDLANKEGREGEATLMYVRKAVAFIVAVFMASRAALSLLPYARLGWLSALDVGLTLVCGAMVVAHLAEVVDNSGLGDGLGLYILCEILKGQLDSFRGVWRQITAGMLSWRVAAGVYGCISLLMLAAIHVSQVGKNLEIVSYNIDPMEKRGRLRSEANQLPLRVAPTGVSCLLSLNLYWSLIAPLVARLGLPRTLPYPLVTTPLAVGVAAWALVALDLSMGKTAAAASKNMQQFGLGLAAQPPLVPGEETAAHLQRQSNLAHFVGGAGVGLLCGLATALDMATAARLGRSFGAVSVLLLTGFITTVYRQVSAASVLPRLGRRLQMEQQSLQTFAE